MKTTFIVGNKFKQFKTKPHNESLTEKARQLRLDNKLADNILPCSNEL